MFLKGCSVSYLQLKQKDGDVLLRESKMNFLYILTVHRFIYLSRQDTEIPT